MKAEKVEREIYKVKHSSEDMKFYIEDRDELEIGTLTYEDAGEGKVGINHVWVKSELRGNEMGKQMLDRAVNYFREKNLKIVPLCPFVKYMFVKFSLEYEDIEA